MSPTGRRTAARGAAIGLAATLVLGGCGASAASAPATSRPGLGSPAPVGSPVSSPAERTVRPTLVPTAGPTVRPGTTGVPIPAAGIVLPVPDGWRRVDGKDLTDPAVRADLIATFPGTGQLLQAADAMGDRAAPAFVAVDPAAAGGDDPLAANIAVLVSQPSVSGPLLDFVAGFIDTGFRDAFGAAEPERDRVQTPAGEAVRFRYRLPGGGDTPLVAVAWVIGAPSGTLLVSVMGPSDIVADLDPDGLIAASTVLS